MKKTSLYLLPFLLSLSAAGVSAQFAPQVGTPGTTAIHKDSSIIKQWASHCTLKRGWQDISDTSIGRASVGDETYVTGEAGNGVVSLGDGGEAIVTFSALITNGPGPDFVVFENGFMAADTAGAFLELAFVEVSSDGEHYFRFDAVSNTDTTSQKNNATGTDAAQLNNLAGKYLLMYGTPFDLEELKDREGLDIYRISHVKIIDVVGSLQNKYASRDSKNQKINDPWPTPFASSGFDLDGVGVIHYVMKAGVKELNENGAMLLSPNPAAHSQQISVQLKESVNDGKLTVMDLAGRIISETITTKGTTTYSITIDEPGLYYIRNSAHAHAAQKILVTE